MTRPATKDILFVSGQLLLFILYVVPLFSFPFHINTVIRYISLILAIFGVLIMGLAILQLNKNLTPFPTPKEDGTLIQNGVYKFIRHPIYTGIILIAIGFGLFHQSLWEIFIGIVLWVLFYFKSSYEEKLLSKHFLNYTAYTKTTGRFFPFV
ncbi:MAG: isoprenylcysteine carboxylmethyltransferase family protein [Saprospiraceae bacterium]|uniref:Isoprenylcysteine carboxylmethyltransferase family protein n=1 Tax=Candidatus Opimibacter skivensis TaxID=2982028 RepID=A0A9D7XUU8_9BACT|nr:isoprenylcysteine carboxylmethyltransferase family protein [Candidatus Opimibacter skivensis]